MVAGISILKGHDPSNREILLSSKRNAGFRSNLYRFYYFYYMMISNPRGLNYLPKRIVSLVPSQTELLYSLGLEEEVIGITKFCIYPNKWFKTKTQIGGTKNLNIEKIISLSPNLIIANMEENVKESVEELCKLYPVWMTDIANLDDSIKMIEDISQLIGKEQNGIILSDKIKHLFRSLDSSKISEEYQPVNACYLIWRDPYMTIGGDTFINDMLEKAGFLNVFAKFNRYPKISIEAIRQSNCEVVMLSSEPFPFSEKHIKELKAILPEVKIILVNGEMFSWYGSRLLKSPGYFKTLLQNVFESK